MISEMNNKLTSDKDTVSINTVEDNKKHNRAFIAQPDDDKPFKKSLSGIDDCLTIPETNIVENDVSK